MPLISVLMGTYNEPEKKYVKMAVDSILSQTFSDFEFIICDDGSAEDFFEQLREFCRKDNRIRLLRNRKNCGLAYTLNQCLAAATGKYIARMDADDISMPQRLEKQVSFLEKNRNYVLTGCSVKMIDADSIWGERRPPRRPGKTAFLHTSPFIHPSIMMHRQIMEELGGYAEEKKYVRVEDYEFFMRVYASGYAGYNLQEPLLFYREDAAAFKKRKYRYRINECRMRFLGYRRLGILRGNIRYAVKPLIAGMVPAGVMRVYRKRKFQTGS